MRIRERMGRGVGGPLRRAAMATGPWTGPLPVLAWAIEHDEGVIVVDTGERAGVRDAPYARFEVAPEEEIGPGLRAIGIDPGDVHTVVLTHLHGDHMDGVGALPNARVLLSEAEARFAVSPGGRAVCRLTRRPLRPRLPPAAVPFDGPAVGAFACSRPLTRAGDVVLVPAPGHTPGHAAVLVMGDGPHRLIAGDASYDQAQLLDLHVDGVSPKAAVARDTMSTIRRHAAAHPTVYLPSHDPGSPARLAASSVLPER